MIEIKNISKTFGNQMIFKDFSLNIEDGEFVVISGASGKGKTTLLNIIGGLERCDSGEIIIDGKPLDSQKSLREYWKNKVGFLFQNFALVENKTVEQNLKIIKKDTRSNYKTDDILEKIGLLQKKKEKVYSLSGGEQQRLALARLFLKKCDIVLADEPTGSLDRKNAEIVINMLKELNEWGKIIILVTHDESFKNMGCRVIEL
ncbi:MAG: ABC transporter ATP-binding protein [Alphaproteobacteria bacterium]|nr:ABC transporter ATP-binding protein [Alphaproteobacteria bacterium]